MWINDAELAANFSAFLVGLTVGAGFSALIAMILVLWHTKPVPQTPNTSQVENIPHNAPKIVAPGAPPHIPGTRTYRPIHTPGTRTYRPVRIIDNQEELDWEQRMKDNGLWGKVKCKNWKRDV
jgi:hypothetical protein